MKVLLIAAIATLALGTSASCQQHGRSESRVPFVGCPSDGQLGPQPAPPSRDTPILPVGIARQLAFYAASDGPGVLAPRGWHCFGVYGSNGSGLVVAPEKLVPAEFFSEQPFATSGDAVELAFSYGGTSGRWAVAKAIARYFPRHRNFIRDNFEELDVGPLPSGPHPHDSISTHTDSLVRYTTPPQTQGAGTEWFLAPSGQPVHGLAMLVNEADGPDLLRVNVRLQASDSALGSAILDDAQRRVR